MGKKPTYKKIRWYNNQADLLWCAVFSYIFLNMLYELLCPHIVCMVCMDKLVAVIGNSCSFGFIFQIVHCFLMEIGFIRGSRSVKSVRTDYQCEQGFPP